jgi:hypothetical protein
LSAEGQLHQGWRDYQGDGEMTEIRIQPFYCGSQYMDWLTANCERCKKYDLEQSSCEIDSALFEACIDDGTVSEEIAVRMGFLVDGKQNGNYNWMCPEVDWTEEWKAEYLRRNK